MGIKIISKRDGFRRCGIAHPSSPTVYADNKFSTEELKRLKEEPMLIVLEVEDEPDSDEKLAEEAKELGKKEEEDGDGEQEPSDHKSGELSAKSYAELRVLAKSMGLSAFGTRKSLIARIKKGK